MNLLLIGLNCSPELVGAGKYTGEMADWLSEQGHRVRVITSVPYYPDWKVFNGFRATHYFYEQRGNLTVHRCPLYVPSRPSAFKRIAHLCSFALSSFPILIRYSLWRPDLIILVAPTLFIAPQVLLCSKLSRSSTLIHLQDFEVDAMFNLGLARGGVIRSFAEIIERFILRNFDWVSTISPGMLKRAERKGVSPRRLRFLPNWSDVKRFRSACPSATLLRRLGVDSTKKVILYSGSVGEKQGLEVILDCARYFESKADVVFLVVGEGSGKAHLMNLVQSSGVRNVIFAPLQPLSDLPVLLSSADCHLIIQRRGAADVVMPSKLTNILAVGGNAVITADPDTSLGRLCRDFQGIATLVAPDSAEDLVRGILHSLNQPKPNRVAQDYSERYLDKDRILSRFFNDIEASLAA